MTAIKEGLSGFIVLKGLVFGFRVFDTENGSTTIRLKLFQMMD